MVAVAILYPFPVLFGEYRSFFRGVLEYFPGSTGVLSGKDWSPFRRGLGKFPYACPGISPGMAREVQKQTEKKFMPYPAD